jgi:hypothetical protein
MHGGPNDGRAQHTLSGYQGTCAADCNMSLFIHAMRALQVRDIDLSRTNADLPTSPQALAAAAAASSSLLTAGLPCAGVAAPEDAECVVCLDMLEVPVVTPCGHWFCKVRLQFLRQEGCFLYVVTLCWHCAARWATQKG